MIGERDPWQRLTEKLATMDNDTRDEILSGRPKTLEAYREQVGYLKAVTEISSEIAAIFQSRNNSFVER